MSHPAIALDIETAPLDRATFSDRQRRRFDKERSRLLRDGGVGRPEQDLADQACSMHPALGWVCCIAIAWRGKNDTAHTHAWSAASPEAEAELLRTALHKFIYASDWSGHVNPRWVTFNGKRFDVPFLVTRAVHQRVCLPPRLGLLDTHRWRHRPHLDAMHAFGQPMGLADACELLGVESPKDGMDGGSVAQAVREGRVMDVARYCREDAHATLELFEALAHHNHPLTA